MNESTKQAIEGMARLWLWHHGDAEGLDYCYKALRHRVAELVNERDNADYEALCEARDRELGEIE